jgi:hypothetical protein
MTHRQLPILAAIVVVLSVSGLASAQENKSDPDKPKTANDIRRDKAFDLLESLADQMSLLQSTENRARLGSNIAGSLWDHDEKRARTLLVSVEDDIRTGLRTAEGSDPPDGRTRLVFLNLRADTVKRIVKRDPDLAFAFFKATEPPPAELRRSGFAEMEQALEIQLAREIAEDSPEIALALGRKSLARGLSDNLVMLLSKLKKKHPDQARLLFREIVFKLRDVDFTRDWRAFYLAQNLARSFTPPAADDSTYRELIELFIASAQAHRCGDKMEGNDWAGFCSQIGSLLPLMEKIDPVRSGRLKQWASEDSEPQYSSEVWNELSELSQTGTVDEILALVSKYPQNEREVYWQAVTRALTTRDFDRARQIAADYRGDAEVRRAILEQVERAQKSIEQNEKKLAEAQTSLDTLPRSQQIALLLFFADRIGAGDPKAALKLLDQASGIVEAIKPGKEQMETQLTLAAKYCLEKSDRGLVIMESLLPRLNELVAAAAKLDRYENNYLREGEWNMSGEGGVGSLLNGLAQNAGFFAWCDFDRAVIIAGQFDRTELRMMAQLKLAQSILAGPPKPLPIASLPAIY